MLGTLIATVWPSYSLTSMELSSVSMVISGAGPTLLALTNTANSQAVSAAMAHECQNKGIKAQVQTLQIDNKGATSIVQG